MHCCTHDICCFYESEKQIFCNSQKNLEQVNSNDVLSSLDGAHLLYIFMMVLLFCRQPGVLVWTTAVGC